MSITALPRSLAVRRMAAVVMLLCGAAFCFAQEKEANRPLHPEVFKLFRSVSAEISYQTIQPMNPTLSEYQLRQVTSQLGDELMVKYGLDTPNIVDAAQKVISRKG